jgi:transposase
MGYPALAGRQLYCGLRQSMPSSRHASCEAVSDTTPSFAEGQTKGRKRDLLVDDGYAGQKVRDVIACHVHWTIKIIERSDAAKSFGIPPWQWVVKRTLPWLGRCCRLTKDWKTSLSAVTA